MNKRVRMQMSRTSERLPQPCSGQWRSPKSLISGRLPVSHPHDPMEMEAERVASRVMAREGSPEGFSSLGIHRYASVSGSNTSPAPFVIEEIQSSSGRQLEPDVQAEMRRRFGYDFSQVRVHADSIAARSAGMVNARAYTLGQDIFFGRNQYAPRTQSGKHLLAHELTHVVQQPASSAPTTLARNGTEDQAQAPAVVTPVAPDTAQQSMIDDARRSAAIRTQRAMFRANGIEGERWVQRARNLARIKFNWPDPNMEQIGGILSRMGGGLINVEVKVAGVGDPECGSRDGYVRGHRQPIILCPLFFSNPDNNEGRIRTMIHEMAHVAGIGDAGVGEQYYPIFDCDSPGEFESADSWANYVHCLSRQSADEPEPGHGNPDAPAPSQPATEL